MDDQLLLRWRAGDLLAGQALFARHFDAIHRFFANKIDDVDELVQATFFACVRGREQFRGQASFRTYLFAIARHQLYRHLRDRRRDQRFEPEVSSVADLITTPVTRLARGDEQRRMLAALRRLPVEQQTLLELHYWEELDAAALAEVFESPPTTIRVRLHRARHALREQMAREPAAPSHGTPPGTAPGPVAAALVTSLLVLAGCVEVAPAPATGSAALEPPDGSNCKKWSCGENSAQIDNLGIHEFHRDGLPNPDGVYLHSFTQGGVAYRLDLVGTRLVGRDPTGAIALEHAALVGSVIELHILNSPHTYALEIKTVSPAGATYWNGPPGPPETLESYQIDYGVDGLPARRNICPRPSLVSNGQQGTPMNAFDVLTFGGDRYDAWTKTITATGRLATGWINLGCAKGTLSKLLLMRHAPPAHRPGFVTTVDERQAALKMLAADYCGTGKSFTRTGEPLYWRDDHGWMSFAGAPATHEAWWNADGASCVEVPRRLESADPYPGGPGQLIGDLITECGGLPPLCSTEPYWLAGFGGHHLISVNPPE